MIEKILKKFIKNKLIVDILDILISTFIIIVIFINLVAIPVKVSGNSMYSTLKNNSYGFSGIFTKFFGYNHFDIVTAYSDKLNEIVVKRIIGLPNDEIEYKDNKLYINGKYYEESFLDKNQYTQDLKIKLKNDEYFLLGDNRLNSSDSRVLGPFHAKEIKTKGIFILFPLNEMGIK